MSTTETMTTTPAEPATAEKTAPAYDFKSFAATYSTCKALYAFYVPVFAVTFIATWAQTILSASPFKIAALESLETLDAFLVSQCANADVKVVEFKGQANKKVGEIKADLDTKVEEVKVKVEKVKGQALELKGRTIETATAKVELVKATVDEYKTLATSKVEETKSSAETKYGEAKEFTVKKIDQTKVVAAKVHVIAAEAATSIKEEISKDGVVVCVNKALDVGKEQVVAAVEVVKAEGVKTLVTNVTNAVVEKINEVPEVDEAPAAVETPSPAAMATPIPAAE